ncbi:DUF5955 family protein [Streptomyces sp. NPDC048290]|uniref:DUF5955 family protein n=1 Tax=Streptomyces sp. NPDC048290 TaxID=3155811 RepID=UPI0034492167
MFNSLGHRPATDSGDDPRMAELCTAVARLRRELAAHPADFPDRPIAEHELASLAATLTDALPDPPHLRNSLLLITASIGSVSALSRGLDQMRRAVERF